VLAFGVSGCGRFSDNKKARELVRLITTNLSLRLSPIHLLIGKYRRAHGAGRRVPKSRPQRPHIENRKSFRGAYATKELRKREYLMPGEVARLLAAAGKLERHAHRDETLLLLAYRHGLRVSELAALRWNQMDLKAGLVHVSRLKNGLDSVHPLRGPELRALRRL
jgi:integrase